MRVDRSPQNKSLIASIEVSCYDNGTWLVNGDPCSDDLTAGRLVAMCLEALAHATANTEGRWLQPSRGEDA